MKKLLALALLANLLMALFACGGKPAAIPNPPLVLGEKHLLDLDYEQALLQFDQAIVIEPKNPRGYMGKADALLHLDRKSEAVQALDIAAKQCRIQRVELNEAKAEVAKSAVDGYLGLASAYEKLGWKDIAIALLKRVCGELPEESRLKEALEKLMGAAGGSSTAKAETTAQTKPKALIIRWNLYDADGTLTGYQLAEHNDLGQVVRWRSYSADGSATGYREYEYNAEGQRIRSPHPTDELFAYEYEYDAQGREVGMYVVSAEGIRTALTSDYVYNEAGQVIRVNHLQSETNYTEMEYNSEGQHIRTDYYDNSGNLTGYAIAEYND